MTEDRALEVIAAYGADSARWPADERAGVQALAARPTVAAALAEAAALDAMLTRWARVDVALAPFDAARLVPAPAAGRPALRVRRRWLAAGAMASAVAAAVALTPTTTLLRTSPPATQVAANIPQSPVPSATATGETGSDADFATVFTPTVDEDALI